MIEADPASSEARARRRKKVIILGSLVLLVGGLLLAGKPLYHAARAWRADQFATAGDNYERAGKYKEAAEEYRAALQLDPQGYHGFLSAARLASKLDRPEAVDLWEQVVRLPEATVSDRQNYADLLLKAGRLNVAQRVIDGLIKDNQDETTLQLASRYWNGAGDRKKAVAFARLAVKRAPQNDSLRFYLATLLALSTEPSDQAEARDILWELTKKEGPLRRSAIDALARAPGLSTDDEKRVLQLLEPLAGQDIHAGVLSAEIRLQLKLDDPNRIYDQMIARWKDGKTLELIELARWLNLHQQAERVLALYSIERAFQDNDLLISRLDALAILHRWSEIDNLLAQPDLAIDLSILECFRARAAQERNAPLDADVHWNHALSLASNDPLKIRYVAKFAEQSAAVAVALKAYGQLAKFPEYASFAYLAIQRLSAQTGDTSVQHAAAERFAELNPNDPDAANQRAYLNLLLQIDVDANTATAKSLVVKYPDRLAFRITAALGCLRQKDPVSALEQFKGPPIEWEKTAPAWRAVYAAVLMANDQREAARNVIATVQRDKLSQEERALIEPAQTGR